MTVSIANGALKPHYLPVLRAVSRMCANDPMAEYQMVTAIRSSVRTLIRSGVAETEIISEMAATREMIIQNLAQVAFNPTTESYSVRIQQDHIPENNRVVNIQTPDEFLKECNVDLAQVVGRSSTSPQDTTHRTKK